MHCSEPAARLASSGYASCHGSFGELLQGRLPGTGSFLVTLPIELQARARFVVRESSRELCVCPNSSWKARRLAEALLRRYDLPLVGELTLEGDIPHGKGLASSTADLVATYRAIASCYELKSDVEVLEALLRDIEPSDGVMHEGIVAYSHREARLLEKLGSVPSLALVAVDEGGEVDTLAHNSRDPDYAVAELDEFARLLSRLRFALRNRDVAAIGAVATRSAEINQRRLPKRHFGTVMHVAGAVDAAGVIVTHSGTCLAILIDAAQITRGEQMRVARERLIAAGLQPTVFMSVRERAIPEIVHV